MSAIADWVARAQPEAVVVDVSVEVATFVRLLGIPVIVMALPGNRVDGPHQLVHRLADHIVAAWPRQLCTPPWLQQYSNKTSYVGGISRFEGRSRGPGARPASPHTLRVLVLGGAGNEFGAAPEQSPEPAATWTRLGGDSGTWQADPWPAICAADVVVTHAGQGCIADVAAAQRPAVVIPQSRPFDEQLSTATVLRRHQLAAVARRWPESRAWPALLDHACAADTQRWTRWRVDGAAGRAAATIEATAQRCRRGAA
ncbi:hypothetical protein Mkiyose1665_23510 [Mycobacterium kiyosense]|uniref:Glycosyl transferase family 28 C-terminal domain-containing protein n=2 Tax=Mycobacteriaceae TaxID=1762 RepID=A0A9P3UYQ2_9MYCO|nr:hypothetical protein IWGMT90018_54740 [Mycobacterium kiyosense]BDE16509.1 hypothetical protein MKCMC460_53690 [Mycobacterium sp. 20KCMC460]GLB85342.1 hypothetical protein SRL2020028_45980 [Mycobacterium kiyosense]GLB89724.1 hypothetical protein SRL2020130_25410 [Mycobacterium kiyosense]GLB98123.1 hypothetical protein SRL2020226_48990 [Mycobacterium kiyosense]